MAKHITHEATNRWETVVNIGLGTTSIRKMLLLAATPIAVLGLTSCGKIAETVLEEGIEQAIEQDSGEEIELDFDAGDGEFSIRGENGEELSINVDGDDGEIDITATDGEGEDLNINVEQGEEGVVITGNDGGDADVTLTQDGEGVSITGTDGDGEALDINTGAEIPDDWPKELPIPEGQVTNGASVVEGGGQVFTLVTSVDDPTGAHDSYVDQLESKGWTIEQTVTQTGMTFTAVSSERWTGVVQGETSIGQLIVIFEAVS